MVTTTSPKVSIIVTSYNYEDYIVECVESCLNQKTFHNYEVIVIDDGSSDKTVRLLNEISDSRLKVYQNQNRGIEFSSNYGIKVSDADYLVRVDADDKLSPEYLREMVPLLENSNYAFAYSNYYIFNANSEVIDKSELPHFRKEEIFKRGDFLATGTLYKKNVLEDVDLYSENVKNCGLENYELILKIIDNSHRGVLNEGHLFYYRRHSLNLSEKKKNRIISYGKKLMKSKYNREYETNKFHPYKLEF